MSKEPAQSECRVERIAPGVFLIVARGKVDEVMAKHAAREIDQQAHEPFHVFVDGGDIVAYTPGFRSVWTKWISGKSKDEMLGMQAFLTGSLTSMALTLVNLATGGRIKGHPSRDSLERAMKLQGGAAS